MTQDAALSILKTGANVFLTGEPGSGKTHAINRYVEYLRARGVAPAITASTGIAATHVGGMTIHSWSGIGIRKALSEEDLDALVRRKRVAARIGHAHVLIIDEISMLDARTLDLAEEVCRTLKQNGLPWGGLQVVFVGDFFQLPPIAREGEEPPQFSFHASAWETANPTVCYLTEQYRQDDPRFLSALTSIRNAAIAEEIHALLSTRNIQPKDGKDQTRLYAHNADVDRVNIARLAGLPGKEEMFAMESRGPKQFADQLKRGCLSPETLRLKAGARVMFTKNNYEEGFVNGTIGEVRGFAKENGNPLVQTREGRVIKVAPMEWSMTDGSKTLAKIIQTPLRLAWAITVHKSQGMTLDSAIVDLSDAFEYGQGYVALSRLRTLEGLFLLGYNRRALEVHPEILEIDQAFRAQSRATEAAAARILPEEQIRTERNFILACGGKTRSEEPRTKKNRVQAIQRESTYEKTLALWRERKSVEDIAKIREITKGTVVTHLVELFMQGKMEMSEVRRLASPALLSALPEISFAFKELGMEKLSPIFQKFGGAYSYDDLRLARILLSDS